MEKRELIEMLEMIELLESKVTQESLPLVEEESFITESPSFEENKYLEQAEMPTPKKNFFTKKLPVKRSWNVTLSLMAVAVGAIAISPSLGFFAVMGLVIPRLILHSAK